MGFWVPAVSGRLGLHRASLIRQHRLWCRASRHVFGPHSPLQNHHHPATHTAPRRALCRGLLGCKRSRWVQMPQLQQMQNPAAVVVQKAKVPGALESLGQHMLQQQPQKILPRQGARGSLARFGIAIAESHHPVLAAQDVTLGNDTPVQIPAQVTQSSPTSPTALQSTTHCWGKPAGKLRPAAFNAAMSLAANTLARALWLNRYIRIISARKATTNESKSYR